MLEDPGKTRMMMTTMMAEQRKEKGETEGGGRTEAFYALYILSMDVFLLENFSAEEEINYQPRFEGKGFNSTQGCLDSLVPVPNRARSIYNKAALRSKLILMPPISRLSFSFGRGLPLSTQGKNSMD